MIERNKFKFSVLFMFLSIFIGSSIEAATKLYSQNISLTGAAFSMEFGLLVGSIFFLYKTKKNDFFIQNVKTTYFYFFIKIILTSMSLYILVKINLFEFRALFLTSEIFMILFGVFLLNEILSFQKLIGLTLTIIGALITIQGSIPNKYNMIILILFFVFFSALNRFLAKKIVQTNSKEVLFFLGTLITTVFYGGYDLINDDLDFYKSIFLIGFVRSAARWLDMTALKYGKLTVLAPISYCELILAAAFGYVMFNSIPENLSIFGAILIVSGLSIILFYERKSMKCVQPQKV